MQMQGAGTFVQSSVPSYHQPSFPESSQPPQGHQQYYTQPTTPAGGQQLPYSQPPQGYPQSDSFISQQPSPAVVPPPQPLFPQTQTRDIPQQQQQQQQVSQQPTGVPQMVIIQGGAGGNRNALNRPFNSIGKREWTFGLCQCCDTCGTCLFAWCCPCFSFGQNMSRFKFLQTQGRPHPTGGEMFNSDCCVYCALLYVGCPCFVGMGGRTDIRTRYQIDGGGCTDCLCHAYCVPCALTQESREIELEERSLLPVRQG